MKNNKNVILIDNDKEQMKEFKEGIEKCSNQKWDLFQNKQTKKIMKLLDI